MAGLSRGLDEDNVNGEILKAALEKAQEELIIEMRGRRYARDMDNRFRRAGTARRTLVTRRGVVEFRLVKVRSLESCSVLRPFLLLMGLEPRRRVIDDLVLEGPAVTTAEIAHRMVVLEEAVNEDLRSRRITGYILLGDVLASAPTLVSK